MRLWLNVALMGILCVVTLQSVHLAFHQGCHAAQAIQTDLAQQSTLEEAGCALCDAQRLPSEPVTFVSPAPVVIPYVSLVVVRSPVDPKTNIIRTCQARGPPSFV